ncbi:selenium cofactor biosynthesis protein YqeC [Halorussus halophilus]|uniref:selenium cofactor biosynthesis protein YqeC n=1 Tax=Halorussus halophilus TaxID=2650975 RepID=UPI001300E3DE|nr:selenium cofactor biosynthesis protein YqeC [Halorussus halophilus]
MNLSDALEARGLVCVVGAGGKKTTLYALADRLDRAIVTATVRIPIFDEQVTSVEVTEKPRSYIQTASSWPLGLVPEQEREDRYRGYDPQTVAELADAHDGPTLVKADGARTRWLKAPNEREPQLPATVDTVLPIASAKVVGKPLTEEFVHRPERVAALTDCEVGHELDCEAVATVLASDEGGLKGVPEGATAVPVVNMVDDDGLATTAKKIARRVLAQTADREFDVPRVVLTQMVADDPVVAVVK